MVTCVRAGLLVRIEPYGLASMLCVHVDEAKRKRPVVVGALIHWNERAIQSPHVEESLMDSHSLSKVELYDGLLDQVVCLPVCTFKL